MESLEARIHSYTKSKRVKSSSTGKLVVLKWSHPPSFSANPHTLAEAGFFYNPSPEHRDSVTCFMCGKELSDWEADDDPFAIHLQKARGSCAWALVRCDLGEDGDDASGSSTHPSSKAMEKARLETFGSNWPYDAVRGHGASSKKMAKAGFAYTPQGPGDDTASCFYCGVALSGWDADDDPLEEHRKREAKSGRPCRFFASLASSSTTSHTLRASTSQLQSKSSKPPSGRPPSRSTSRKKITEPEPSEDEHADDDNDISEEEDAAPARNPRARASVRSRASTATVPAKTPGSRKSVRTTGTTKTPSTRTRKTPTTTGRGGIGSEAEGEDDETEGEGSEGKKVSRSKSKGKAREKEIGKKKGKIEAIKEEDESHDEEQDQVEEEEPEIVEVEKPKAKRGRPPGSGKRQKEKASGSSSGSGSKTKEKDKKTPAPAVAKRAKSNTPDDDSDIEEIPPPTQRAKEREEVKPKHTRTRSKHNLAGDAESEVPEPITVPSTAKTRTHAHTQPKSKTKAKTPHTAMSMEVEVVVPPPPGPNGDGKAKVSRSKSKPTPVFQEDEEQDADEVEEVAPIPAAPKMKQPKQSQPSVPARMAGADLDQGNRKRKSSATSDDGGYATAATEVEHHMDVDDDAPVAKKFAVAADSGAAMGKSKTNGDVPIPVLVQPLGQTSSSDSQSQTRQQIRASSSKPTARVSSRTFSRAPSRGGHVNQDEVVDVSSDEEEELLLTPPPIPPLAKSKVERAMKEREDRNKDKKAEERTPMVVDELSHGKSADKGKERQETVGTPDGMTPNLPLQKRAKEGKSRTQESQPTATLKESPAARVQSPVVDTTMSPRHVDPVSEADEDVEMGDAHTDANSNVPAAETDMEVTDDHGEISAASPPPHTPSVSPRNSEPPALPPTQPPPPMPSFDDDLAHEDHERSTSPFTPFLSLVPLHKITSLSAEESDMTIEQFIRREIELQYQQFKEDGERQIASFRQQAAETRRIIEAA